MQQLHEIEQFKRRREGVGMQQALCMASGRVPLDVKPIFATPQYLTPSALVSNSTTAELSCIADSFVIKCRRRKKTIHLPDIPDESGLLHIMEAQLLHTGSYSCHEH